jgi:hypothetical protein
MKQGDMKADERKEDPRMKMMREMHEGPTRTMMKEPMMTSMKRDKRGSRKMER